MPVLHLGEQRIHLDIDQLVPLLEQAILPGGEGEDAQMGKRMRAIRIAMKGAVMLLLDFVDWQIVRARLPIERPQCPKGADYIRYGFGYLARFYGRALDGQEYTAITRTNEDGSISITALAPATAGALPPAGAATPDRAPDHASPQPAA